MLSPQPKAYHMEVSAPPQVVRIGCHRLKSRGAKKPTRYVGLFIFTQSAS
jgi:hypothetical protein